MELPAAVRKLFYRAWRHTPRRLRALAVRIIVPRAPAGAAVLLFDEAGRLLLVRQTYQRGERWSLPGGWAKRGEPLIETAAREAQEELGVAVNIIRPLSTGRGLFGDISVVFEASWKEPDRALRLDAEIAEARFFPTDALPPLVGPSRRLVGDALAVRDRYR